jgi:hypothetical protein
MKRIVVIGVGALVALLVLAVPALARWTTGKALTATAGPGVFELSPQAKVECESAKSTNTETTKEGRELNLRTIAWEGCRFEAPEAKISKGISITCNNLILEQPTKEGTKKGKATGKATEECVVAESLCTVRVPVIKANTQLGAISLVKEGSNQVADVEVSGITAEAPGAACEIAGVKGTKDAKLKVPRLLVEGIGLE